jgi:hypothetical protein
MTDNHQLTMHLCDLLDGLHGGTKSRDSFSKDGAIILFRASVKSITKITEMHSQLMVVCHRLLDIFAALFRFLSLLVSLSYNHAPVKLSR